MSTSIKYRLWCWRKYWTEVELRAASRMVTQLNRQEIRCVDVGAHAGVYSFFFARSGATVEAFEPIDELAKTLRTRFGQLINVHQTALSDSEGEAKINVPMQGERPVYGFASITKSFSVEESIAVERRRLDSFKFENVVMLKVDVEGHELEVLQGAERTLVENRPIILVEAEERHRPDAVTLIASYLEAHDYSGFIVDKGLLPLRKIGASIYKNLYEGRYVNNFFFLPKT
jgi:FkbM family methyltransferase